jgi:transposase
MINLNLAALAKSEKSARKRMRYLALLHFTEGHSRTAIANMLKVSRTSVNAWVTHYLTHGISGLDDKHNPGRPAQLSAKQQVSLKKICTTSKLVREWRKIDGKRCQSFYSV